MLNRFKIGYVGKDKEVSFRYLGDSSYDPYDISKDNRYKEGTPITYWRIANDKETIEEYISWDKFHCDAQIDYNKYSLLISYGREIVNVKRKIDNTWGVGYYDLTLTFDAEHRGEKVFFYQIPKGLYAPAYMAGDCYIIRNGTATYIGSIDKMNKSAYEGMPGV